MAVNGEWLTVDGFLGMRCNIRIGLRSDPVRGSFRSITFSKWPATILWIRNEPEGRAGQDLLQACPTFFSKMNLRFGVPQWRKLKTIFSNSAWIIIAENNLLSLEPRHVRKSPKLFFFRRINNYMSQSAECVWRYWESRLLSALEAWDFSLIKESQVGHTWFDMKLWLGC